MGYHHLHYTDIVTVSIIIGALLYGVDSQPSECPMDATSCCQCVIKPGCIWSMAPQTANQPRCVRDEEFSSVVNELVVPSSANRPFNPRRKRFLRPQGARLKMSIGLRKEVPIRVLAQTRRIKLVVVGPSNFPDFSIEKGDGLSCVRRFRVREKVNTRKNQKKLSIDCHVSAVGGVQKLHLIVDMTRCYQPKKEIKVNVKERGSRKFRLEVASSCQCPCRFDSNPEDRVDTGLELCEEGEAMTQCSVQSITEANQCSGVNDYCRRNQNEPVCSGHGTCICGVCSCDFVPLQESDTDYRQIALSDSNVPQTGRQRYAGAHCQCDDISCPRFNGLICGGPERGRCVCGQCVCADGYSGPSCDISRYADECLGPDGLVCGGTGHCINNQCECQGMTQGPYCQPCTTCPNNMCNILAPCVQCFAFQEGETNRANNCTAMCSTIEDPPIRFVLSDGTWPQTASLCAMQRNECHYEFVYNTADSGEIVVNYQNDLHCDQN